jgi:hypothetical protein
MQQCLKQTYGLAGSVNADFNFVIASQGEMVDAMDFSLESAGLPQHLQFNDDSDCLAFGY